MDKQALSVGKRRLVQLACLLLMLFVALRAVPRAPAQASAESENTLGSDLQLPSVPSDTTNATRASPAASCQGPLYDQYNNPATEPPIAIGSQKFEAAMAAFDSEAADDFVLPSGFGAIAITGVRVMGEYSAGGGPASSFNVYFYENGAGNLPGSLIHAFMNLPYTGTPPDFVICLPTFGIAHGTYWISVQANQDSNPNGQWFWHNRTIQTNAGAAWQNPGGGYGTGCVTWNRKSACMADQVWPDQVFQIFGVREGPPPTPVPRPTPRPRPTPAPRLTVISTISDDRYQH
ncbi:MAG TPA: hypothetical protein VH254_01230 [Candidatus Udaeobacter sp.]|nr:hypothetical protein [Candidatus Udaeobacter sp.]